LAEVLYRAQIYCEHWSCTGWCSRCHEPRDHKGENQGSSDAGGLSGGEIGTDRQKHGPAGGLSGGEIGTHGPAGGPYGVEVGQYGKKDGGEVGLYGKKDG